MIGAIEEVIRGVSHYRIAIAMGVPLLGGSLALAASLLTPRGKMRGPITGAYLLLAALGCSFLFFAVAGLIVGAPRDLLIPLLVPGIALAVVMGIFSPVIIREYQHFEFRKLAAEIFPQKLMEAGYSGQVTAVRVQREEGKNLLRAKSERLPHRRWCQEPALGKRSIQTTWACVFVAQNYQPCAQNGCMTNVAHILSPARPGQATKQGTPLPLPLFFRNPINQKKLGAKNTEIYGELQRFGVAFCPPMTDLRSLITDRSHL